MDLLYSSASPAYMNRYPFGDEFCGPGETEESIIFSLLRSYVRLCARLLHIDAEILSRFPGETLVDHHLLCLKHLKALNAILRAEGAALFRLLAKDYNVDIRLMGLSLVRDFIKPTTNGLYYLAQFAELAWAKVQGATRNHIATNVLQLLECTGWSIIDIPSLDTGVDRTKFSRTALRVFRKFDEDLQIAGKILDVGFNRDMVLLCAKLLHCLVTIDDQTARDLAEEFLEKPQSQSVESGAIQSIDTKARANTARHEPQFLPALISNAWKFKLLKKYILKGRMELRVMCIGTMDSELVEIWKEYNASDKGTNHPVMQYLAEFLLREKVIDYIIGVDSHPQLISRSGNIVGFLVVTHRYTEAQTDAIWETVSTSPDPRVVSATIVMLRNIVNLMDTPELLYICAKLYELPIEAYTLEILRFCRDVSPRIQQRFKDWSTVDPRSRPSQLCVRLIQDTAPSRASTKLINTLQAEASDQLRALALSVGLYEREKIYESCVRDIRNKTNKATGSAHAIHILCYTSSPEDTILLTERFDLARYLIPELCAFVQAERTQDPSPFQTVAMQYRLDLIAYIIAWNAKSVPLELYEALWDHLVGKYALDNSIRDIAWSRLTEAAKFKPSNVFCSRLISDHIPKLEPVFFTFGLYDFIHHITLPLMKKKKVSKTDGRELLEVPGANLLWRLILIAPPGTIEDLSATLLATRYIEVYRCKGVSFDELEDAHVALVEQCTERLLSSYLALRSGSNGAGVGEGESMAVVPSDDELHDHERRFTRTLLFEKLFLQLVRTKPEFTRARRSDSKCEPCEPETIRGDPIEIRFQVFGGATSERQALIMGKEDTFQELHERLGRLTGFSKLTLIVGGKKLALQEWADKRIGEIEGITWVLVSKAAGAEPIQPENGPNVNCSAFETSILKHFEELYTCMDSEDDISEAVRCSWLMASPRG